MIYGYFNRWAQEGIWQQIHTVLAQRERQRQGRPSTPSAGSIDSQSIKMARQPGPKGFDAGNQINGRERHCLVDTLGLIISLWVAPANTPDPTGLKTVLGTYLYWCATLTQGLGRWRPSRRRPQNLGRSVETAPQSRLGGRQRKRDRLYRITPSMGRRTHLCLAFELPPPFKELRSPNPQ